MGKRNSTLQIEEALAQVGGERMGQKEAKMATFSHMMCPERRRGTGLSS